MDHLNLEQALNIIGSDILQVNDMFNKTCEINEMKNKGMYINKNIHYNIDLFIKNRKSLLESINN